MSLEQFIPSVWSGQILRALDTALVFASTMTRDFEGDAKVGNTVRISMVGDITVSNYTKNVDIASPEALQDAQLILAIDQAKYFNFKVDDVDQFQQMPKVMGEATRRAAYSLRRVTDSYCANLYTDISPTQAIGSDASPITGTWTTAGTLAYDRLVDLGVLLDQTDTPDEGRFCIVPPWFEGYMLKDQRFVGYGTQAQDARLTSGDLMGGVVWPANQPNDGAGTGVRPVGIAAGFEIYKSNQIANTTLTKYKIIAGHPSSWAFVDQIMEVRAYTPERSFGDAIKGLHVYGGKVIRPANLALLTANPT